MQDNFYKSTSRTETPPVNRRALKDYSINIDTKKALFCTVFSSSWKSSDENRCVNAIFVLIIGVKFSRDWINFVLFSVPITVFVTRQWNICQEQEFIVH